VTEEVSRAERRLLPQDDPARQPPCFKTDLHFVGPGSSSTHHSAGGEKTETRLACSDTEATACRLLQLHWVGEHPPRSSPGKGSTSWSVWDLAFLAGAGADTMVIAASVSIKGNLHGQPRNW